MTKYDPQRHPFDAAQGRHRRSIRLKGYDYSQAGAYFVTIVTYHRDSIFGKIVDQKMMLNSLGKVADECWRAIPDHFPNVELGVFVVMPNHVHGIIWIQGRRGTVSVPNDHDDPQITGGKTPPLRKPTLGQIVAYFKYKSTKEMNLLNNTGTVTKFWQSNYYEHIIRNDTDLQNKTDYIESNPLLWDEDDENPVNIESVD